jgi:hypothetical protein
MLVKVIWPELLGIQDPAVILVPCVLVVLHGMMIQYYVT